MIACTGVHDPCKRVCRVCRGRPRKLVDRPHEWVSSPSATDSFSVFVSSADFSSASFISASLAASDAGSVVAPTPAAVDSGAGASFAAVFSSALCDEDRTGIVSSAMVGKRGLVEALCGTVEDITRRALRLRVVMMVDATRQGGVSWEFAMRKEPRQVVEKQKWRRACRLVLQVLGAQDRTRHGRMETGAAASWAGGDITNTYIPWS